MIQKSIVKYICQLPQIKKIALYYDSVTTLLDMYPPLMESSFNYKFSFLDHYRIIKNSQEVVTSTQSPTEE